MSDTESKKKNSSNTNEDHGSITIFGQHDAGVKKLTILTIMVLAVLLTIPTFMILWPMPLIASLPLSPIIGIVLALTIFITKSTKVDSTEYWAIVKFLGNKAGWTKGGPLLLIGDIITYEIYQKINIQDFYPARPAKIKVPKSKSDKDDIVEETDPLTPEEEKAGWVLPFRVTFNDQLPTEEELKVWNDLLDSKGSRLKLLPRVSTKDLFDALGKKTEEEKMQTLLALDALDQRVDSQMRFSISGKITRPDIYDETFGSEETATDRRLASARNVFAEVIPKGTAAWVMSNLGALSELCKILLEERFLKYSTEEGLSKCTEAIGYELLEFAIDPLVLSHSLNRIIQKRAEADARAASTVRDATAAAESRLKNGYADLEIATEYQKLGVSPLAVEGLRSLEKVSANLNRPGANLFLGGGGQMEGLLMKFLDQNTDRFTPEVKPVPTPEPAQAAAASPVRQPQNKSQRQGGGGNKRREGGKGRDSKKQN